MLAKLAFMDSVLQTHTPSETTRAKAEAADIDLDALKRSDPERYKMMNAGDVVDVDARLVEEATAVFLAAFPRYEIFRYEASRLESLTHIQLLSFPPLSQAEQGKFDDALARLSAHPKYSAQYAYFRITTDQRGEHRQFALPVAPDTWQGGLGVLVGPFMSEAEANTWQDAHRSSDVMTDVLPQNGAWFCDVFASV